jgi:hypothetical protein
MNITRANLCRTASSLGFQIKTAVKAQRQIVFFAETDHRAIEHSPQATGFLQSLAGAAVDRRLAYFAEGATQNLQRGYFYGLEDTHVFGLTNAVEAFMAVRAKDESKLVATLDAIRELSLCPGSLEDLFSSGELLWPVSTTWQASSLFSRQIVEALLRVPSPFISEENTRAISGCLSSPETRYGIYHSQVTIGARNSVFSGLIGRTLPALSREIVAYVNIGEPNLPDLLAKLGGN